MRVGGPQPSASYLIPIHQQLELLQFLCAAEDLLLQRQDLLLKASQREADQRVFNTGGTAAPTFTLVQHNNLQPLSTPSPWTMHDKRNPPASISRQRESCWLTRRAVVLMGFPVCNNYKRTQCGMSTLLLTSQRTAQANSGVEA